MPVSTASPPLPEALGSTATRRKSVRAHWFNRLPDGWPLGALFVLYPLWWLLGVTEPATLLLILVMARELHRRHERPAVPGLGWWLMFLVWVVAGVLVVQVNAPLAVPGASLSRYLTWGIRIVWFFEVTVVLLYVGSLSRRVGTLHVARILGWMFVTITVGGLLGALFPLVQLRSLTELALPGGLRADTFVQSFTHPTLAERHEYLGVTTFRPSAPYAYANTWGLNFACFLPFFVYGWLHKSSPWRRRTAPVVLAVAIVPVIYSLNRGLWAVLILSAVYVAGRLVAAGRKRLLVPMFVGAMIVVVLLFATPLKSTIEGRFTGHESSTGRAKLLTMTVESSVQGSPVMGFGTTRNVQGSFYSIAGGASATCRLCSPPAFGTQGFFWYVTFSQGLVGVVLCMTFFLKQVVVHRVRTCGSSLACYVVVLTFVGTSLIYDWTTTSGMAVMTAIALLAREPPIARSVRPARHLSRTTVVAGAALGATVATASLAAVPLSATATTSIFLPEGSLGLSMDTEARYMSSPSVKEAIVAASGNPEADAPYVTARPNSRVLNLAYTARTEDEALRMVSVAGAALLRERRDQVAWMSLVGAEDDRLRRYQDLAAIVQRAVVRLESAQVRAATAALQGSQNKLQTAEAQILVDISESKAAEADPARVITPAAILPAPGRRVLRVTSGALVGLLCGLALARRRARRGPSLGRTEGPGAELGLPVTAWLDSRALRPAPHTGFRSGAAPGADADDGPPPQHVSADPRDAWLCRSAARLEARRHRLQQAARVAASLTTGSQHLRQPRLLVVAWTSSRVEDVRARIEVLRANGSEVVGLVLLTKRSRRPRGIARAASAVWQHAR